MGRRGRSARRERTSAGCSSGGPALRWVAMAAPGRMVLWPAVAGLPCRRRWGWDHTSIPRPGVGCLPRWEGSSRGCWPRSRRETEAGQHGSGSKFDEVLTPTTRVAAPHPGQEHHRLERHSQRRRLYPRECAPLSSRVGRLRSPFTRTRSWRFGGSNPLRRATNTAGHIPGQRASAGVRWPGLLPNCDHVDGRSPSGCDHHGHTDSFYCWSARTSASEQSAKGPTRYRLDEQ
jgi:hypothetical protein